MNNIKSGVLLATCFLAFSAVGFYAGNKYSQHHYAAIFESRIVHDAALQIPVLSHALKKVKSGDIEEAIITLEGALKIQTVLLGTCSEDVCKRANRTDTPQTEE